MTEFRDRSWVTEKQVKQVEHVKNPQASAMVGGSGNLKKNCGYLSRQLSTTRLLQGEDLWKIFLVKEI